MLNLCFALPTKVRPDRFASRPNSGICFAVFSRTSNEGSRSGKPGGSVARENPAQSLDALISKVLLAHVGEAKLDGLKAFSETIQRTTNLGDVTTATWFVQPPDCFRCEIVTPATDRTVIVVRTTKGMRRWVKGPEGNVQQVELGGLERSGAYWSDFLRFFGPKRVLRLKDPEHQLTLLGESKIGARTAMGIRLTKRVPGLAQDLDMFFDRETGLLLREEESTDKFRGEDTTFGTYRDHQGISIALRMVGYQGKAKSSRSVLEFKLLDNPNPKLFEEP